MATVPISKIDWEMQETTILELEIKNALTTKAITGFEKDLLAEMLFLCESYRTHLKGRLID